MSVDPRANQKARTRSAIVDAAARLIQSGQRPSVPEAAHEARVSRATAYRYFPTQESLLLEAAWVTPAVASVERMLADYGERDPAKRIDRLVVEASKVFLENEASMRLALRSYLEAWLDAQERGVELAAADYREGRRMRWIETSLAPLSHTLDTKTRRRLAAGLALTIGIEPLVVLKDVCGLPPAEIEATLRWTAQALLDCAMLDATVDSAT